LNLLTIFSNNKVFIWFNIILLKQKVVSKYSDEFKKKKGLSLATYGVWFHKD